MALSRKKIILMGSVVVAGIGAFFLFRKGEKLKFIDNLACGGFNEECKDITPAMYGTISDPTSDGGSVDADPIGYVSLLFAQPHGLTAGEQIFVEQNEPFFFSEYNGWARVLEILNPYVIRIDKQRLGNTPINGGTVQRESVYNRLF